MSTAGSCRIGWWGHSTTAIELDGARLLTDPVVAARAGHLARMTGPAPEPVECDAVLISHLHLDHFHLPSLRRVGARHVIGPRGTAAALRRSGIERVTEVEPWDEVTVGAVTVRAVPAVHDVRRRPWSARSEALGFMVTGSRCVYFAGDTGLFEGMWELGRAGIDVALLPIWGWGPTLGRGAHLDPLSAAEALVRLAPRWVVPIHWGTYAPMWTSRRHPPAFLTQPMHDFATHAERLAPEVHVAALHPGGAPLAIA
jgi:L-ascorbate metabolism protein UlaG (beta-lactamase superfamily)